MSGRRWWLNVVEPLPVWPPGWRGPGPLAYYLAPCAGRVRTMLLLPGHTEPEGGASVTCGLTTYLPNSTTPVRFEPGHVVTFHPSYAAELEADD